MSVEVPTQEEYAQLVQSVQQLWDAHAALAHVVETHTHEEAPPPDPDPDPQPDPPPPPPDPDPPQDVVYFTDMPSSFENGKTYMPSDTNRVYEGADLRGTDGVALKGVHFTGRIRSSRYDGAVKMGKNSTLDTCVFNQMGSLCVEIPQGGDNPTIKDSTFTNNAYNAIWSHAWYRKYNGLITRNYFDNNNTKREAENWDAADIKLLHHLNIDVIENEHAGGFGDAIWYDSDANGQVLRNTITGYHHAIYMEMCWFVLGASLVAENVIDRCGSDPRDWIWHAAIVLSGSSGVTVRDNTVTNSIKGKDYAVLAFPFNNRNPHHSGDRVHAAHGEVHEEYSGHNYIDTGGKDLYRGNYPEWHWVDTDTYVLGGGQLIDR
ncbi:right-handed parallel beta-helix repeat-containing protein [Porticoccus sp.]